MEKSYTVRSLVTDILKFNLQNILYLTFFLFLASFFETITLISIVPIMDLIILDGQKDLSKISENFLNILKFLNLNTNNFIFFFFIFFSITSVIFIVVSNFFSQKIKYNYCNELIKNVLKKIYNSNLNFFVTSSQGKLINTLTRETQLVGDALSSISRLFSNFVQVLFLLAIPVSISIKSTLIIIFILIIIYSPFVLLGKLSQKIGLENTKSNNNFFSSLQEYLSFYKNILSFGLQNKIIGITEKKFKISSQNAIKSYLLDNFISNIFIPITIIGILLVYFFSNLINFTFSELSVVMAAFYRISSKSNLIIKEYSILNRSISSFDQINEIIKEAEEHRVNLKEEHEFSFKHKIFFNNISFSYDESNYILKDINLEIKKGEKIALFGKSGSGKSTVANLLLRLIEPTKGTILIDDKNILEIKKDQFKDKVCYVAQENILINQSIIENFKLIKDDLTKAELENVCKKANILDFINSLPQQFNTILGEGGSRFSGGQIQRLSIARALIRKPEILILDEATSALDDENSLMIEKVLNEINEDLETTIVIVSHKLSFVENMDKVFYFDNGKIVEKNTQ